ncbi:MAG: biotin/lipoyl-binding protein, partial [Phycisphaerae bacterium]|nr:biotin/lipoyl-binding protein [Phycisphaerae bacterium]
MRRTLLIMALLAAGAIGVLYWSQHRPGPFYVSGVVEADDARVGSRVGGRIARVHVVEGQRVEPRQPLFELEPFDLRER